jgi:ankyrin repeat protein
MTKSDSYEHDYDDEDGKYKPLGLLCGRLEFPKSHEMVSCLIEIDNSIDIIYDGINRCIESCKKCHVISPGSRGERMLILLERLLKAYPNVIKYKESSVFYLASKHLKGELGVAVLLLFHSRDNSGIKSVNESEYLPIYEAACYSSVEVLRFLHEAYPESLTIVLTILQNSLLHAAVQYSNRSRDVTDIIQYLLERCPAMINMVNSSGLTPLHCMLYSGFVSAGIKMFLDADPAAARSKYTPSHTNSPFSQELPLHIFIQRCDRFLNDTIASDLVECLRLLLRIYPGSGGIKDSKSKSSYDLAVERNLNVCFICLLLNDDLTIDPMRRRNLNFAARKEGIFLAFRALSTNLEPITWSKIRYEDKNLLARIISYSEIQLFWYNCLVYL